ncbi:MAG: CocE/NonD family hydrolase, partial [Dehalococcoidales bacterium]|nr:CocE/NonD family hydrolase [Dehalococcoidales bacterium]
ICSALVKSAIVCLRFNFRGAGDSGGCFGGGVGEQDDVKAALDFLANSPQIDSMRIGLAGYSFGGSVVLPVALMDSRVKQLALISPALKEAGWAQLKDYVLPKLILVGDADISVPFRPFQKFFGDARQYQVIAGADHFWCGFEEEMSGKVARFHQNNFQL